MSPRPLATAGAAAQSAPGAPPRATAPGIEFRAVSKRYGDDRDAPLAVDRIDLAVERGTLTTILGPSGCGKTTTLRMIAGLEMPTDGTILIDGEDVTRRGPAERNVSLVFQSYALFPHMDVLENVGYGLRMAGMKGAALRDRAAAALDAVGLAGFERRLPSALSGGQQQRVALARALVLEPAVLLFDEPLSNLDARLRRDMREEIRTIQQRLRLTVAYVTHDQAEALAVSDRIVVMNRGRIAQEGTPRELYERPVDEFVAGFMGEARLFDARVDDDGAVWLGPLQVGPPGSATRGGPSPRVAVRPQAWSIAAAPDRAALPGRLAKAAYLGHGWEFTFDTALGEVFMIGTGPHDGLRLGDTAMLRLDGVGVSLIPAGAPAS
ncbi:MAG: ABC transporter ATP-binding protein [Lautropia sp.]